MASSNIEQTFAASGLHVLGEPGRNENGRATICHRPFAGGSLRVVASKAPAQPSAHLGKGALDRRMRRDGEPGVGPYEVTQELHLPAQEKTGEPIELLILPPLQAAIDALAVQGIDAFLVTAEGKPFSKGGLGNWFRDNCLAVGLGPKVIDASGKPKGLSAHGLRKRMGHRLAELGCGDEQIAAVFGHTDTRQVKVYTKGANKRRMATPCSPLAENRREHLTYKPKARAHKPPPKPLKTKGSKMKVSLRSGHASLMGKGGGEFKEGGGAGDKFDEGFRACPMRNRLCEVRSH